MMNALQSHIRRASLLSVANRGLPSLSAPEFRLNNAILRSQCIKFNKNINNTYVNKRSITSNSWAADKLEAKGEVIEKVPREKDVLVTRDLVEKQATDRVKRLVDEILELNLVEINQLLSRLQSRLGLSDAMLNFSGGGGGGSNNAAAAQSDAGATKAAAVPAKEKEAFDIKLTVVDAKSKIKVIKEVRAITGLGLKEAKELVEKAPVVIKTGVKKDEIEAMKKILLESGAQIEVI